MSQGVERNRTVERSHVSAPATVAGRRAPAAHRRGTDFHRRHPVRADRDTSAESLRVIPVLIPRQSPDFDQTNT